MNQYSRYIDTNQNGLWHVLLKREKYTVISHRNFVENIEKYVVIEGDWKRRIVKIGE